MWTHYLDTMLELNQNIKTLPILKRSVLGCAFKAALDAKKISELHCNRYIEIMIVTGAADNLILNVIDASLAIHPNSVLLWVAKMKFYIQRNDDQKIVQVFEKAKHKLGNDSPPIWTLYIKYLLTVNNDGEKRMKDLFQKIVIQPHDNFRSLKVDCIENTFALFGIKETRKFFNDAVKGIPCLEMYNKMVRLEELQVNEYSMNRAL